MGGGLTIVFYVRIPSELLNLMTRLLLGTPTTQQLWRINQSLDT